MKIHHKYKNSTLKWKQQKKPFNDSQKSCNKKFCTDAYLRVCTIVGTFTISLPKKQQQHNIIHRDESANQDFFNVVFCS